MTRGARLRYAVDVCPAAGAGRSRTFRATRRRAPRLLIVRVSSKGGRRAGQHRIQQDARACGRVGQGRGVRRAGDDRDRLSAPQAAGLFGLRRPRAEDQGSSRQALAASGSGRVAVRDRVRSAPALLPRLRRSARARGVGALRSALYARFRRPHGVAGAADEPDAGHAADADRLGDGRQDPRAGRGREARSEPAGRARADRRGRGLIRGRSQVPDLRGRPRDGRDRVGG